MHVNDPRSSLKSSWPQNNSRDQFFTSSAYPHPTPITHRGKTYAYPRSSDYHDHSATYMRTFPSPPPDQIPSFHSHERSMVLIAPKAISANHFTIPLVHKSEDNSYLSKNFTSLPPYLQKVFIDSRKTKWLVDTFWKQVSPTCLDNFFWNMPKGGGLHSHLSGSFSLEILCAWIHKYNLWFDPEKKLFVNLAEGESSKGLYSPDLFIVASKERSELSRIIECIRVEKSLVEAENKFFNSFDTIESILAFVPLSVQISQAIKDAQDHTLCYQELMHMGKIAPPPEVKKILDEYEKEFSVAKLQEELDKSNQRCSKRVLIYVKKICSLLFEKLSPFIKDNADIKKCIELYKECDISCGAVLKPPQHEGKNHDLPPDQEEGDHDSSSQILKNALPISSADSPVTVRIVREIDRCQKKISYFFWDVMSAYTIMKEAPHIVTSVTVVGHEPDHTACVSFPWHMLIFRDFKIRYDHPHLNVHCGEFPYQTTNSHAKERVRDTVELADPTSLGHALAISKTKDMTALIGTLREKDILVEVPLSSNSYLAGYQGARHPAHELWRQQIPTALATDDQGIFNTNATKEFTIAYIEYGRRYRDFIQFARNSLHYSTLGDKKCTIYSKDPEGFWEVKQEFLKLYDPDCDIDALASSPKERKMIHYERSLAEFQAKQAVEWQNEVKKDLDKRFLEYPVNALNDDTLFYKSSLHGTLDYDLFMQNLIEYPQFKMIENACLENSSS